MEGDELPPVGRRRASDCQADQVHGQESAPVGDVGDPVRERSSGDRRDRRERTDRRRQPRERPHGHRAEHDADREPDAQLAEDEQHQVAEAVVRVLDPGDQPDRERDGHRVVAAGLGLERAREPPANMREPQSREHGCRVRRGDDRAEQDRLQPRQIEEPLRREAGEERRDHDADGREQRRGHGALAEPPPRRRETAREQNRDESGNADLPRQLGVVEFDPARPVRAEQHPQPEEGDQGRHTGARRPEGDDHARRKDAADDQEDQAYVHGLKAGHASSLSRRAPALGSSRTV